MSTKGTPFTQIRLTDVDLAKVDQIQEMVGIAAQSEAIRHAIDARYRALGSPPLEVISREERTSRKKNRNLAKN